VAAGRWGLRIINIANPASPTEVGFYDSPGIAKGVALNGNWLYLADGTTGGLKIIDVTNPANPVVHGTFDSPGEALKCQVIGTTLYLADGSAGLRVLNVANPDNPTEVGYLDPPGTVNGTFAPRPTLVYLAAGDNGLIIASYVTSIADEGSLKTFNYGLSPVNPNPFTRRAVLHFQVPGTEAVSLRLFDTQGRLIRDLVKGRLDPGAYTYSLDAQDLASGVYFVRLEAGTYQKQQKVTIIR
jgi:hypothetical protein